MVGKEDRRGRKCAMRDAKQVIVRALLAADAAVLSASETMDSQCWTLTVIFFCARI